MSELCRRPRSVTGSVGTLPLLHCAERGDDHGPRQAVAPAVGRDAAGRLRRRPCQPGQAQRRGGGAGCGARAAPRQLLRGARPAACRPAGRAHPGGGDRRLAAACGQPGVGDPVPLPQPRRPRRRRVRHRGRPARGRPGRRPPGPSLGAWVQRAGRPVRALPSRRHRRLRARRQQVAGRAAGAWPGGGRHRLPGAGHARAGAVFHRAGRRRRGAGRRPRRPAPVPAAEWC
jgi:hypothetical protein